MTSPFMAEVSMLDAAGTFSEDCLVLNVWTSATDAARRPVMVYLHGGGYDRGSASMVADTGANLCRRGDVVVVTLNHRMGVFGYLYLAELAGPRYAESGNLGTLDVLAALRWVRDNIAAFGGDPDNVTIFGISGGGAKVTSLLAVPEAAGLFHRAIAQSGADVFVRTPEESTRQTERLLHQLGMEPRASGDWLEQLLSLPVEELVAAEERLGRRGGAYWPVLDGVVLEEHPGEALRRGAMGEIPLVIGSTRDETSVICTYDPTSASLSHDGLMERLPVLLGDAAPMLIDTYRSAMPGASDTDVFVAITTDWAIRVPSLRLAEAKVVGGRAPVFVYEISLHHPVAGGIYRAVHSIDTWLVFDACALSPSLAASRDARVVAGNMADAWIAFARAGVPSAPGLPEWVPYTTAERATMVLDSASHVEHDPRSIQRRAWAGIELSGAGLVSRTIQSLT